MTYKPDSENFGMVLGLVKTVKLENMDLSIDKSITHLQNTITELSKTISKIQEALTTVLQTEDQESCSMLSERLSDTISIYNQASETLCALLTQHISSSMQIKEAYSKMDTSSDIHEEIDPDSNPS